MSIQAIFICFLMLCSCSSQNDQDIKKKNAKADYVVRQSDSSYYPLVKPEKKIRDPYPWEKEPLNLPKITKEFFRCKGSPLNPPYFDKKDPSKIISDCEGCIKHSLPIIHGKEGVYPVLLDILNYIQQKTKKRVIITSGHSCPNHFFYMTGTKESKHMIGAGVDFYVQGLEKTPQKIIDLILEFYKENPSYRKNPHFENFSKISTSWSNKEIVMKIFSKNEGRDFNNRHPYPYINIQVKYDRDTKENISFSWEAAQKSILHW
jgi:hypothetical protein